MPFFRGNQELNKYKWIYSVLKFTGLLWFFNSRMLIGKQQFVLCYHRISEQKFSQHISYLKAHFNILPLKSLLNLVFKSGDKLKGNSNKPFLALTMDDCYSKEFQNAFIVCQSHHVHCTYFVPTHYTENQLSLWALRLIHVLKEIDVPCTIKDFEGVPVTFKQEIDKINFERKWIQIFSDNKVQTVEIEDLFNQFFMINELKDHADVVIGKDAIQTKSSNTYTSFQSHTVSHPKLYLCSEQQLVHEFEVSRKFLFNLSVNEEQYVICYPYGSKTHIGNSYIIASNYYEYGVTLQSGIVTKQSEKMLVPRIGIYEHDTYQSIRVKMFFAQLRAII